jgi:predicted extracellular nuclease
MRRVIVAIMMIILGVGTVHAQIMFWNVENFFDTYDDPKTADEDFTQSGRYHLTKKKYQDKRNLIAKTILASADSLGTLPHIIALAEVENKRVLTDLIQNTPLAKVGYKIVHKDSRDARGIDVALLYNPFEYALIDSCLLTVSQFATRDVLYCQLLSMRDSSLLHLFVNHWPSKRATAGSTDVRREAVSRLLSDFLGRLIASQPQASILLVGDFNDDPGSNAITQLCAEAGLVNLSEPLWKKGLGTIRYHGKWELIDQAIASEALANETTYSIFAPDYLLEEDKAYLGVKPRRTFIGPRYNAGASDHLPITTSGSNAN